MKKEKKVEPSLLRKITTFVAILGLIATTFGVFLHITNMIDGSDQVFHFMFAAILITIPCGIITTYLIIKEEKYWTNDPMVMSPLRKFGKIMSFVMAFGVVIGIIFGVELIFIITSSLGIVSLILWKIKFSNNNFSSKSPNIFTDPSYRSLSGNIYNR